MKWKYKVIALSNDANTDAKELTSLGSIGWELIAVHGDEKERFAYLKLEAVEARRPVRL
jgi:hypothetical protein